MPHCRHSEADKLGANGIMYIVCTECGETLTRAPDERQEKNKPYNYMPKADEAFRFIQSNPATAMNMVAKSLNMSKDDPWSRGFAACLYLFNDRYADYRRERDQWLKEKYECVCTGLAGDGLSHCPVHDAK